MQSCPGICGGETGANVCYPDLLTCYCACTNGTSPDCMRFIQTLPFFICEATYQQCVNSTDSGGQKKCERNAVCGYEDPAAAARAAIPSGQSLSIGATTIMGTAGASIEISAVATPSTGSTAGKSSSLSVGAAAGIEVGCTGAAVFVAALFIFFCVRRRRAAKKGHLNTAARQVGSHNGDMAAGHQEYRR